MNTRKIDAEKKLSGLLIPVFALRREGDLGIGDTLCVIDAIDFLSRLGMDVLQVLPINETGADNSPYNALSSTALDPVYLSMVPDMVPGLSAAMISKRVDKDLLSKVSLGPVDYATVKALKLSLLRDAYDAFGKEDKSESKENLAAGFAHFKKQNWLDAYSLFRSFMDENGGSAVWTQWKPEHSSLEKLRKIAGENKSIETRVDFYKWVQWVAFRQWEAVKLAADKKKIELMGDIPFGVSRYSADVFGMREQFDLELSGGAPPETFFQSDKFTAVWGQNWGIPLYHWSRQKEDNFSFWKERVAQTAKVFHYFRIDHVLGFFRVYAFPWIPERNGEFVDLSEEEAKKLTGGKLPGFQPRPDEPEENARLNCQEGSALLEMILDAAGDTRVVAEDLGMVPDYVRPRLQELGIPGFIIPIFERIKTDPERNFRPIETYEKLSLATLGTHDHEPIALYYEGLSRWWHGENGHEGWREVQRLMRFCGLPEDSAPKEFNETVHRALIEKLMLSPSWLSVLMISDLLASKQRFNEPGIAGASNWSQRLDKPLSAYENDAASKDLFIWLKNLLKSAKRGHVVYI